MECIVFCVCVVLIRNLFALVIGYFKESYGVAKKNSVNLWMGIWLSLLGITAVIRLFVDSYLVYKFLLVFIIPFVNTVCEANGVALNFPINYSDIVPIYIAYTFLHFNPIKLVWEKFK